MLILQVLVGGIAQGCIYGLIALGFVLIYKATETVNFAQGELMMLGAFCGLAGSSYLGLPFVVAALGAVAVMAVFGLVVERAVIRPVLGQPAFAIIMLTIGISYVTRGAITMVPNVGTDTHTLPVSYANDVWSVGAPPDALVVSVAQIVVIVATTVLCAALDRKSVV